MNSKEEFSFKPINKGLGFHRKKIELKDQMKSGNVVREAIGKNIPGKPVVDTKFLKSPLPRNEVSPPILEPQPKTTTTFPAKDVIDELVKSFKKPNDYFIEENSTPKVIINPVQPQSTTDSKALPWMVSPFFVDAMLVVAMVLSCLLISLMITKVDLLGFINQGNFDWEFMMSFPFIAIGMTFAYMTISRILLKGSLGELVFDVQLGSSVEQKYIRYNFQVIARTLIAIGTGLFLLPILSLILRKDYLGSLSGLKLYNR